MSTIDRNDDFARELDEVDLKIAELVKRRIGIMARAPRDYDSDGEGEIYSSLLPDEYGERVYHAVAKIE